MSRDFWIRAAIQSDGRDEVGLEKRRRAAALQNLADTLEFPGAAASWSAVALHRFSSSIQRTVGLNHRLGILHLPDLIFNCGVIALIDYGSGNLPSVHKALLKVGADVRVVQRPGELMDAQAVVLPGVGAFDDCVNALHKQNLLDACRLFMQQGRPFLGICVGYQALFEKSEEFNSCASGLGVFKGSVVRFSDAAGLKIPQIGWNQLENINPLCPLFRGVKNGDYVYFVHSFFPKPEDASIIAARTTYGETFASAIWRDNVFATQFHPEKSQKVGLQLLKNFVEYASGREVVRIPVSSSRRDV